MKTLRIAICDDEKESGQTLREYTERYLKESGRTAALQMDVFSHPDELLCSCETTKYHLFLLDILMPMVSGIDAAREIQSENPSAFFVFCTSSRDYPIDAYMLNAIHYLMKPVGYEDFQTAMNRFFSRFDAREEFCIHIPDLTGQVTECSTGNLLYIDVDGKFCHVHLQSGEVLNIRSSIVRLSEELADYPMLYRMGGSCILNLGAIRRIEGSRLLLKNRECLYIPRTALAETRKKYIDYYNR